MKMKKEEKAKKVKTVKEEVIVINDLQISNDVEVQTTVESQDMELQEVWTETNSRQDSIQQKAHYSPIWMLLLHSFILLPTILTIVNMYKINAHKRLPFAVHSL